MSGPTRHVPTPSGEQVGRNPDYEPLVVEGRVGPIDMWIVLGAGCAECGDWPLVFPLGIYATSAEAADSVPNTDHRWMRHPMGGFISQSGSGAVWIAPTSVMHQKGSAEWDLDDPEARIAADPRA